MKDTTDTENLKERCIERVRETVESERESLKRYGPALAVCALVVASMLAGVPFSGEASAQETIEVWTEDFDDGNAEGWQWSSVEAGISDFTDTGTHSLRVPDGSEEHGNSPRWVDGPRLDTTESFEISGKSYSDHANADGRTRLGMYQDDDTVIALTFSQEYGETFLASPDPFQPPEGDTINNDFDQQWVNWRIRTAEEDGILEAKVWPVGDPEPEEWEIRNEFDPAIGQFWVEGSLGPDGSEIYLEEVTIEGLEADPPDDNELYLETKSLLLHGESADYTVYFNGTADGSRVDVTEDSTVTSSNEEALTVDDVELQLVATEDETINASVQVTAEYTHDTVTYETYQDVTVAVVSVANMQILPGTYRYTVLLGDWSYVGILISTMFGVIGARMTSAFGGIAGVQLALTAMWVGGLVSLGIALVGLFASMFIGLNLAANINYMGGR